MSLEFSFSYKKTTQAINFFAAKENNVLDKLKGLKLVYFADRYHLRKYGRLITNDEYFAMDYGPVASGTKDILEMSDFLGEDEKKYALNFLLPVRDNIITSIKSIDDSELSKTEIDALNFVWEKLGDKDGFALADLSHKYPEWKKFESDLKLGLSGRIRMDLLDFFEDSSEDIEKFYELNSEEKAAKIDYIKELYCLESLWN